MAQAFIGIDHCVIGVRDLDASAERYRRLGFNLTPRGTHSAYMGTGNYCIMFQRDYVELLGVLTPTEANAGRVTALERDGEGLREMALAGASADAAFDAFAKAKLSPLPAIEFSRPVKVAEGTKDAKFRVVRLPFEKLPGLNLFMCQHYTRELVWLPAYQRHTNGALGIAGLLIASPEPKAAAAPYAALLGSKAEDSASGVTVAAGTAVLRFSAPNVVASAIPGAKFRPKPPFVAALDMLVDDLGKAGAHLKKEGVRHSAAGGSIVVGPEEACGVAIRFVARH
ncbi:MAG TPA: VOC family protein [Candidatus Cybelea sp.]|nr:VOC family protein [Candidatus Cybelea sp.]